MKFYVMGDASMVEAFELIGLPGRVVESGEDVGALLDGWAAEQRESLVLLQIGLAENLTEEHLDRLARRCGCLVLPTPGLGDGVPPPDDFLQSIHTAIGAVG